ncbi:MAG: nuclear transport factor 2 family protein [Deltaproteobacteria bacterium]|nr:nuclear transport factor 2 family protein [Deltaproteobacteria bacterium]
MKITDRFLAYAAAFEQAFASDDWSVVAPHFTEDAVYETPGGPPFGGRHAGRAALLANFKQVLDAFDRRFASRQLEVLAGPEEREGAAWVKWRVTYTLAGAPDLRIEGEELAFFRGDQICRLEDRIPAAEGERTMAYMAAHGARLAGG